MLSKIAVNFRPALGRKDGVRLQQSLLAMPGVKQVVVAYPNRVEVHYDGAEAKASSFLTVIKAHGLNIGLQ